MWRVGWSHRLSSRADIALQRLLLRRVLWVLPTLAGVAIVVFVLVRVLPGDPIAMMMSPGAKRADIERLYALHGLDRSIPEQFVIWSRDLLRGDLGRSMRLRDNVGDLIASRLPATIELVIPAMLSACILGFSLAMASVAMRGRRWQVCIDVVTGLGQAIPDFLWGLLLILGLGVLWPLFPVSGRVDPTLTYAHASHFLLTESLLRGQWQLAANAAHHLTLPVLALALPLATSIARVLKGSLLQALNEDYVTLVRAKGYSPARILCRVALPNALIPTVALTGVQFAFLVGGTVLIEHLFGYPGIGNLAMAAVMQRDLPLVQGLVLAFALIFVVLNLSVDVLCILINPRLRVA